MEIVRYGQQHQAHKVKCIPYQQVAETALYQHQKSPHPCPGALFPFAGEMHQTVGAEHAFRMLRDTLATEEPVAFRTAHHRFSPFVVAASFVGNVVHLSWVPLIHSGVAFAWHFLPTGVSWSANAPMLPAVCIMVFIT